MMTLTGLTFPELSTRLQTLSLHLIATHLPGYARQVLEGFVSFWKGLSSPPAHFAIPAVLWTGSRMVVILVNACFAAIIVTVIARGTRLLRLPRFPAVTLWIAALILIAAVGQAITEYGDAPRFGMPTQPLTGLIVATVAAGWFLQRHAPPRGTRAEGVECNGCTQSLESETEHGD
jgi:hypothetical protein